MFKHLNGRFRAEIEWVVLQMTNQKRELSSRVGYTYQSWLQIQKFVCLPFWKELSVVVKAFPTHFRVMHTQEFDFSSFLLHISLYSFHFLRHIYQRNLSVSFW
jgi:hypothetical protein